VPTTQAQYEFTCNHLRSSVGQKNIGQWLADKICRMISARSVLKNDNLEYDSWHISISSTKSLYLFSPNTSKDQAENHWRLVMSSSQDSERELVEDLKAIVHIIQRFW
jgi:hypothetical protein